MYLSTRHVLALLATALLLPFVGHSQATTPAETVPISQTYHMVSLPAPEASGSGASTQGQPSELPSGLLSNPTPIVAQETPGIGFFPESGVRAHNVAASHTGFTVWAGYDLIRMSEELVPGSSGTWQEFSRESFFAGFNPEMQVNDIADVIYLTDHNRFVVVSLGRLGEERHLILSVSDEEDPFQGWSHYSWDANYGNEEDRTTSYPTLAHNQHSVYVSIRRFGFDVGLFGDLADAAVFQWSLSDLLAGASTNAVRYQAIQEPVGFGETVHILVPFDQTLGNGTTDMHLVSWDAWYTKELIYTISGTADNPGGLTVESISDVGNTPEAGAQPQAGSSQELRGVVREVTSAFEGSNGLLYFCYTLEATGSTSDIRCVSMFPDGNARNAKQYGDTGYSMVSPALRPWCTSAADFTGETLLTFVRWSTTDYPGTRAAILDNTLNSYGSVIVRPGLSPIEEPAKSGAAFAGTGDLAWHPGQEYPAVVAAAHYGAGNRLQSAGLKLVADLVGCTDPEACDFNPLATISTTCQETGCFGCTDPEACNYLEGAIEDDGTCVYPGCTDSQACNFDPDAGCNEGCCYDHCIQVFMDPVELFGEPTVLTFFNLTEEAPVWQITNSPFIFASTCLPSGCYVVVAEGEANFTINSVSNAYGEFTVTQVVMGEGNSESEFSLGIYGPGQGCTDNTACNYAPDAICDNGTCCYQQCFGLAFENVEDLFGAGWQVTEVESQEPVDFGSIGTLDPASGLPQITMCIPDGCYELSFDLGFPQGGKAEQAIWTLTGVGDDQLSGTLNETVEFTVNGGNASLSGCTDPTANNYNPNATCDNGQCCFDYLATLQVAAGGASEPFTAVVVVRNNTTGELFGGTADREQTTSTTFCLEPGCYSVWIKPPSEPVVYPVAWLLQVAGQNFFGDQTNTLGEDDAVNFSVGGQGGCTDPVACNYVPDSVCETNDCTYAGCTDPNSCNYDPEAGCNDPDMCDYTCLGCTYSEAENYDPTATIDDGSCILMGLSGCLEDLNLDGQVGTADILTVLGSFGSTCTE